MPVLSPAFSPVSRRPATLALGLAVLAFAAAAPAEPQGGELRPIEVIGTGHRLEAPPGVRVEKLADLEAPRLISLGRDGEMFIGSKADRVYRLAQPYTTAETLVELDDYPHSVVRRDDRLYVATTDALLGAPYRSGASLDADDFEEVARLPGGGGHNSRTLVLGPDARLYVALGIQGNCSNQYIGEGYDFEDRRGGVMVLDEGHDPPRWAPYATGLRNPIGLAWDHRGVLHAINNGPDHWGYDEPREVLVRAEANSFHGMPWFQWVEGGPRRDDCIGARPPRPTGDIPAPVATLPARSAPMGLAFLPRDGASTLDAVAAVHGSWATKPSGGAYGSRASRREPRLVGIRIDAGGNGHVSDLLTGFQDAQGQRWARPVGVAVGPDGALYFTSDAGDTGLYRVSFDGGAP